MRLFIFCTYITQPTGRCKPVVSTGKSIPDLVTGLDGFLGGLPAEAVNFPGVPADVLGGESVVLAGEGIEDGEGEHGGAAGIGMEEVGLQEGAGFAIGHALVVEGNGLVGHGVVHEIGEGDDDNITALFGPLAEAFVGGEAGGFAGNLGIADDAGGGGGGSIGNISHNERTGNLVQQLQAVFKMAGAIGVRGAFTVTEPEHEIDGDDEGGMGIRHQSDLHGGEGIGIEEEQGGGEVFDGRVRFGDGSIEVIAETAFGGIGAAERFGENEPGGGAGADHDDMLPGRISGAEGKWEQSD